MRKRGEARAMVRLASAGVLLVSTGLVPGCMSPGRHREKADSAAEGIIEAYQQEALDRAEPFTIEEPSDSLRRRLMIAQELPGHVTGGRESDPDWSSTASPLRLTLVDALQVGARNNRSYQAEKEKVFSAALDLDLQQYEFRNSYSALLSTLLTGTGTGADAVRSTRAEAVAGVTRRLEAGATLTGRIGLDLVKLLTMDKTSTYGILADATVTIPLLRGAGRDVVREPLTQAERNMIYAIWAFERFKQGFAITVANSYLRTLENQKLVENAEANYQSVVTTRDRVEDMARAGRMSQTEVDQARQNELTSRNALVVARRNLLSQLDSIKTAIGIPIDARIELDAEQLTQISRETMRELASTEALPSEAVEAQATGYVLTAFTNRLDLATTQSQFEDALRKLAVTENALDPDMQLRMSAATRQTEIDGGRSSDGGDSEGETRFEDSLDYSALLKLDLPWDRTAERVAYRKSLIALRGAERAVEEKEDSVKEELRSAARNIAALQETYRIQELSVRLAETRVESTDLLLQAGQVYIRDLLDAQDDLVEAQNAMVSAVVNYHIATLNLQRDLGLLIVNEKGLWNELK